MTLLSACGNSQITSNKAEIEILVRDGDDENFSPRTDDYVYAIKHIGNTDGEKYENTILISFDENGKRVQWVEREISEGNTVYTDLLEEYGYEWELYSVETDKFRVLSGLGNGSIDSVAMEGDYYYSEELTSQQTMFENQYSEADFMELSTFTRTTDDYYIVQYADQFTDDGYTSSNNRRPGSERVVQGLTTYDYDYTVEWYGAFSYSCAIIISFDEAGKQVGLTEVYIMDSEEMVESLLKQRGCDKWDEVSPTTEVDWEMANTMGYHTEGKYVWNEFEDFDSSSKKDYGLSDTDKTFFSKPYLTDSQIKEIKTW